MGRLTVRVLVSRVGWPWAAGTVDNAIVTVAKVVLRSDMAAIEY